MSETQTQLGLNKDISAIAPADMESALIDWGDRQRAEEANQGYTIQRLERESLTQPAPVPAEEVLPLAFATRYGEMRGLNSFVMMIC